MRSTLALLLLASLSGLAACSSAMRLTPCRRRHQAHRQARRWMPPPPARSRAASSSRAPFRRRRSIRMSGDRNCVPDGRPQSAERCAAGGRWTRRREHVRVREGRTRPVLHLRYAHRAGRARSERLLYTPRVIGVRVGQAMEIVNSDPTMHNVHALPMANQEFNHGQPKQNMRLTKMFTAPEVMVRFKCDVHSWMAAWVGVMAHPYFAVYDDRRANSPFRICRPARTRSKRGTRSSAQRRCR